MERREAPGSLAIGSLRPALRSASLRAELPGPKCLRAVGVPGREGPCEEPCASRRSIADRVVGGRTLLRHPTSRSTTPSIEQGMASVQGLGNGSTLMRITVFACWGRSRITQWIQDCINAHGRATWCALHLPHGEELAGAKRRQASRTMRPPGCCNGVAAPSFETHRFAMLLRMRRTRSRNVAELKSYAAFCFAWISLRLIRHSAICTALSAAPLRRLSDTTHIDRPFSTVASSRMRLM